MITTHSPHSRRSDAEICAEMYTEMYAEMYAKIYAVICAEMARVLAHPTSQPAERHSLIIDGAFFALQRLDLNAA